VLISGQQLKFKQASAKVRKEGIKPFTKAFGTRMKQILGKSKRKSSHHAPKRHSAAKKKRKSNKPHKGSGGSMKKGGTKAMTRFKKFLLGFGIGAAVSTVAGLVRVPEVESAGPIIDALAGAGVEGQVGTAIPRLIRQVVLRSNGFGGGTNGLALEGA